MRLVAKKSQNGRQRGGIKKDRVRSGRLALRSVSTLWCTLFCHRVLKEFAQCRAVD